MAPPFIFPLTLISLEDNNDSDCQHLTVQNLFAVSSLRATELEEFVNGVSFDLSDKELFCVEEQEVFDRVYCLVKDFASLSPGCKFNLVESLRSNMSVLLPSVTLWHDHECQYRRTAKMIRVMIMAVIGWGLIYWPHIEMLLRFTRFYFCILC